MGEGGYSCSKGSRKSVGLIRWHTDRKKSSFVVIDGKPRGIFKDLQDTFSLDDGVTGAFKKNKRIVSILKDGTRRIGDKGVNDSMSQGRVMKQTAQEVSNDNEEVGRERVSLPETIPTVNPPPRHTVEEDRGFASGKESMNPFAPPVWEAPALKNSI